MIRLEPLPKGICDPETERMLSDALEYEGWQEAETLYKSVHAALANADKRLRARALMDHARVLRQLGKESEAAAREAEAESLLGEGIEREELPKSSVEQLNEDAGRKKGFFGRLFGK